MPVYEYKCNDCDDKFEVKQSFFHSERPKCPKCQSDKTRRVFSASPRISSCDPPQQSSGFG
jgi:putative FmdB family regulatory protein